jgi:Xaa-Pro aminopeptidase
MIRDVIRIDSIQSVLRESRLDALVCSLPANVRLLTGYWPIVGPSVAIVARGAGTILIVPEDERELAGQSWADEIRTFQPGSLADLHRPEEAIRGPLADAARSLGAGLQRLGFENGGMVEPASYTAMYLFGTDILSLLRDAFPSASLIAMEQGLGRLRSVKTPTEIECIRDVCQIAAAAFRKGACCLSPGLKETLAAAQFHRGLCESGSICRPGRWGGFAWCMSGPNSANACAAYARSDRRELSQGDLVLIHCNSYVDGLWSDITRTYCLGTPDQRMHRMYEAVFAARSAALEIVLPGVKAAKVDEAARKTFGNYGWEPAFKHSTGHGVGFGAIDAQALPRLHPKSDDVLQPGMVFNVEPAVYFEGYGGLRHCDIVALTSTGAELLTPFQTSMVELALP